MLRSCNKKDFTFDVLSVFCIIGSSKNSTKKKVRFFNDDLKILSTDKQDLKKLMPKVAMSALEYCGDNKKCRKKMPLNWQVMYTGIINYKNSFYIQ